MSDDLQEELVKILGDSETRARQDCMTEVASLLAKLRVRVQAAEIREPSRLERVQAALPEDWHAGRSCVNGRYIFINGPDGVLVARLRDDSPLTPEEAVEAAKKLAGVE